MRKNNSHKLKFIRGYTSCRARERAARAQRYTVCSTTYVSSDNFCVKLRLFVAAILIFSGVPDFLSNVYARMTRTFFLRVAISFSWSLKSFSAFTFTCTKSEPPHTEIKNRRNIEKTTDHDDYPYM